MHDERLVAASVVTMMVTLVAIFSLRPLARRVGLVDKPDERKRHRGRIPVIGGLCFFLGTIAGLSYLGNQEPFVVCLLGVGALVLLTGLVDDLEHLTVRSRLLIETGMVGLVIIFTGIYVDGAVDVLGVRLHLAWLGIPFTLFAVIGLINAFNMLDGIDGLAGALALVSIVAILAHAGADWPSSGIATLLQILAAALLPYLCVNLGWPDGRKIFMGDAGSTLLGFLLAWSLVYLSSDAVGRLDPVDVPWCIALPVMDTLAVMYRRVQSGASPFRADRLHLHHLLMDAGFSPRVALAVIVAVAAVLAAAGYALRTAPDGVNILVFVSVFAAYLLWLQPLLGWLGGVIDTSRRLGPRAAHMAGLPRTASREQGQAADTPTARVRTSSDRLAALRPGGDGAVLQVPGTPIPAPAPGKSPKVRVLCVIGAAPDHVRMIPIVQQLAQDERFETITCATAPDGMAGRLLGLLGTQIDRHVDSPGPDEAAADRVAAMLGALRGALREYRPDVVVVHGDSPTSLATALAAHYEQVPLARVETGSPPGHPIANWPNEAHDKIIFALASFHLASTASACRRLAAAGIADDCIQLTDGGWPDGTRLIAEAIKADASLAQAMARRFAFLRAGGPMLFAVGGTDPAEHETLHLSLQALARERPDLEIVCHGAAGHAGDPTGRRAVPPNLHVVEALDYLAFAYLIDAARIVLACPQDRHDVAALSFKPVLGLGEDEGRVAEWAKPDVTAFIAIVETLIEDQVAYAALCATSVACAGNKQGVPLGITDALARLRGQAPSLAA